MIPEPRASLVPMMSLPACAASGPGFLDSPHPIPSWHLQDFSYSFVLSTTTDRRLFVLHMFLVYGKFFQFQYSGPVFILFPPVLTVDGLGFVCLFFKFIVPASFCFVLYALSS